MRELHADRTPSQRLSAASVPRRSRRLRPSHPTPASAHPERARRGAGPESSEPRSLHPPPPPPEQSAGPFAADRSGADVPAIHRLLPAHESAQAYARSLISSPTSRSGSTTSTTAPPSSRFFTTKLLVPFGWSPAILCRVIDKPNPSEDSSAQPRGSPTPSSSTRISSRPSFAAACTVTVPPAALREIPCRIAFSTRG